MSDILNFIEFNQYNLPQIVQGFLVYLLFLWLAVLVWVLRDILVRTRNPFAVTGALLLVGLGNFAGLILYLLIRPGKTITEKQNDDLFYASVLDKDINTCPSCSNLVRIDFGYCPFCSTQLNQTCPSCDHQINSAWRYCIHCQTDLAPKKDRLAFLRKINSGYKKASQKVSEKMSDIKLPEVELHLAQAAHKPEDDNGAGDEKDSKVQQKRKQKKRKRSRGRPKGQKDKKPRKKRSDAGKKRGSYKK